MDPVFALPGQGNAEDYSEVQENTLKNIVEALARRIRRTLLWDSKHMLRCNVRSHTYLSVLHKIPRS